MSKKKNNHLCVWKTGEFCQAGDVHAFDKLQQSKEPYMVLRTNSLHSRRNLIEWVGTDLAYQIMTEAKIV